MIKNKVMGILLSILFLFIFIGTFNQNETVEVEEKINVENDLGIIAGITEATCIKLEEATIEEDIVEETSLPVEKEYTEGWTTTNVNIRKQPTTESDVLSLCIYNTKVEYVDYNDEWIEIKYKDGLGYMKKEYISNSECPTQIITKEENNKTVNAVGASSVVVNYSNNGNCLTRSSGVFYGPSGKETYYNLPMGGVIYYMQQLGYNYDYWVRSDGVKMYGDYIMIATNTYVRPKGSIIQTSLGAGMVCDHCEASEGCAGQIDIAVTW